MSTTYDLDHTAVNESGHITSDKAGNIYLASDSNSPLMPILRMTPEGKVSQFTKIKESHSDSGFTAAPDGSLVTGGGDGLWRVSSKGTVTSLESQRRFKLPNPIGIRPDGTVVVIDGESVWSLKDGQAAELLTFPANQGRVRGAVAPDGTIYLSNSRLDNLRVLAPGSPPRTLTIQGDLPGAGKPLSEMAIMQMTPATDGGVYAKVQWDPQKGGGGFVYIVHIAPSGTLTAMARASEQGKSCAAGEQYAALDNPCVMPWFLARSGDQVLALGDIYDPERKPSPALAIHAPRG
ncbi:hypothetical protein [Streptomyces hundungensis]|uniref:hypothetical protein n=1 Tax=Streptomyces hundungensis TaxID=1077946 RepID=UPI000EA9DF50|nr:hypothetical protein [Streptomyces hundungensis]